ncbi:carboxylesterase [Alkalihalobacillus alcalophilus ATCC 27647 = CGMCC 1.3604]|uniref:Carboxylesterase n=1 Tax=Alkalihalobacillus alcalophilus ATCC 27647 = CGMCC 1.3604 TaxID=1218173 RepID=A0A094XFL6_ALKAL|nr:carboxylesterase [Alkalihalobacillus alcalophilus]KGA97585.1 carboxylesterase [Alkalihalobacillus alcalophilus ATCC 27647 = CGMCC 1.3604]MED1563369.1 carboxylesterase [Alkalihalobacillus alcalophilus]THG90417.1 carboxylesterase [Alkalihalobacillus alcalophilus ATCC 27647 = CGMCC 1.3604]
MRLVKPKPFTFEAGDRAVLLLHGFTGTTADVRMLGRYLHSQGYTCHAPLYEGHGVPPEELMKSGPEDWWKSVKEGYDFLKNEGYEEIAVCGLSLGGVFSLKIGYTLPVKGIIPMCAPVKPRTEESIYKGLLSYATEYKKREKKTNEEIEEEMTQFKKLPTDTLKELRKLMTDVSEHLDHIYTPTFVVQARKDDMIDPKSADVIHDQIESDEKKLKWYEKSGHSITIGPEKEQLHEDVFQFLEQLDWTV